MPFLNVGRITLLTLLAISLPITLHAFKGDGDEDPLDGRASLRLLNHYLMPGGVRSVSVSSDGRFLAVGGKGFVSYFHTGNEKAVWAFLRNDLVDSLSMSSNGGYIVAGMEHATTYYFSNNSREPLLTIRTDGPSLCTDISKDGRFFTVGTFFGVLYLIDGSKGRAEWVYRSQDRYTTIISVAISGDARLIAAGTSNNEVLIFDHSSPQLSSRFRADGFIHSLDFSKDGRYLVAGSNGSSIYLFDTEFKRLLWSYKTNGSVRSVSIAEDGAYVAVGSYDGGIYLFKREFNDPQWVFQTQGLLKDVRISSSKDLVVAGGTDRKLRVLMVIDGELVASYNSTSWITSVSLSYNGSTIAYSEGANVKVLKFIGSILKVDESLKNHLGEINIITVLGGIVLASIAVIMVKILWGKRWLRKRVMTGFYKEDRGVRS